MKKIQNLIVLLICLVFSGISIAQDSRIIVDDDRRMNRYSRYRSPRGDGAIRTFLKGYQENPLNEMVLKFNPLQIFRGEVSFSFEKTLSDRCSATLLLGPTISNLSPITSGHYFPGLGGAGSAIAPVPQNVSKAGIMIGTAFRYYPMNDHQVTNGMFVEPQFKFRRFNEGIIDREEILQPTTGGKSQYRFAFNMGVQRWYSNRFSLEYYVGAGINYQNDRTSRVFGEYDFNNNTVEYTWKESQVSDALWFISGGINIGIGWSR